MKKECKILIVIALSYIFLISLFIAKFDFNPSATIGLSQYHLKQFEGNFPNGIVVHSNDGFDGQYYYMMALDPSLDKVKITPNFLQRIIYPLLARVLALNITALFPLAFILINLCSVLITSWVLMEFLKKYNANLNLVFLWAFNVGFLISITRNLTEPLMMCFIALTAYFFEKEKHWQASALLALAILTRELALTVFAAMLLYFLVKKNFKIFLVYALSIVPFCFLQIFFAFKFGVVPAILSSYALSIMPRGFLDYFSQIFPNVNKNIIQPAQELSFSNTASSYAYFRNINKIFSPLPILAFTAWQLAIVVINYIKDKKISKYLILLFSQLAMIMLLQKNLLFAHEIDGVGRYALPMFFFSILYFAERGKKYSKILAALMIISSALYFIQRFIIPKGPFWLT